MKKPLLHGERWRLAGRVTHLAGHFSNPGRAMRPTAPYQFLLKPQEFFSFAMGADMRVLLLASLLQRPNVQS